MNEQDVCRFRLDRPISTQDDCQMATVEQCGHLLDGDRIIVHNVQADGQPDGVHVFAAGSGTLGIAMRCDETWHVIHMEC